MRRLLSTLLIALGAVALGDALLTLAWQEPASAVYARVQQERLGDELDAAERTAVTPARPAAAGAARATSRAAKSAARRAAPGDALGRLEIPAIGLRSVLVEGTAGAELRSGPGHYPGTPLPGARGTVAVAGHRTTYGAPFRRIGALDPGDRIVLRMPYGNFSYRVERTLVVAPGATWVTRRAGYDRLVLTACHPLYSARQRLVVFARADIT